MLSESAYLKIFVVNNGVWIIFLLPWIMLCNLYIFPVHFHLFVDIFTLITYKPADVNENNNQQNLYNPLISVWMKYIMIKRKLKIQFINKQQILNSIHKTSDSEKHWCEESTTWAQSWAFCYHYNQCTFVYFFYSTFDASSHLHCYNNKCYQTLSET